MSAKKKAASTLNVIDRDEKEFTRQRSGDIRKMYHTQDVDTHKFQQAREFTRALNATKLDKMFAKPFVSAFDSHTDGVYVLSRIPQLLPYMLAGDGDGVVKLWNIGSNREMWTANAHRGRVRGLCAHPNGTYAISCAADKTIKIWNCDTRHESMSLTHSNGERFNQVAQQEPLQVFMGDSLFSGVDHHSRKDEFVSCGNTIDIWDPHRNDPVHSFRWGCDSILSVKYNRVDQDVICSTGNDRSIVLYDTRTKSPLHKIVMMHMNNSIAWNPQEAYNFVVASEDTNVYSFDMRNLKEPSMVYLDHVSPVLGIDFSPTGREFVTGSYDKTIRLWECGSAKSRDIYSTKRMQHVFSVQYTGDSKYVCSGSDDANLRVWKAHASEKMGVLTRREVEQRNYSEKLKERYAEVDTIKRVAKRQIIPKHIRIKQKELQIQNHSRVRKLQNISSSKGRVMKRGPGLKTTKVVEDLK